MRLLRWSSLAVLALCVCAQVAGAQGLDRNAQRIVNDATRDLKSRDVQKRVDAIDQLASWGKLTTAPLVIGALKDPSPLVRAAAANALWDDDMKTEAARGPLRSALEDTAPEVAVLAAGALRMLGVERADLQKANERGLSSSTDPRIRFLAARALIGLVPPVRLVNALTLYLERQSAADASANVDIAEDALEELRDTDDRSILVPLMEAIPDMKSGAHVVMAVLGKVDPRPDGWLAMLMSAAARPDVKVRRQSLNLMRDIQADADVAKWAPIAARLLAGDAEDSVRIAAAMALQFAGGAAHAHAPAVLTAARRDRDAGVREFAFDALAAIIGRSGTAPMSAKTTMAKTALPEIQAAVDGDPEVDVRESAIDALDALALDPAQSASLLLALASRPALAEDLRTLALSKLRNRGGEARSVTKDIEKLKSDPSAAVRDRAAEALDRIANDRSSAAPARAATAPVGRGGATAASTGRGATPAAAPKSSAADEARGLSVIRARKIEFQQDQFYKAIGDTDVELARAFLDAGMSARNPFPFARNETPLTVAVSGTACSPGVRPTAPDTITIVQTLIARGADASLADDNGNTPLMQAAMGGCDAVVMNALLKAGAQLNAVNQAGLTAFEFGLFAAHDGLNALLAAGYKLPAAKVKVYLDAYKANPNAVALIKRATP